MEKSLYAISFELESLIDKIIENDGEITDDIEKQLKISKEELYQKLGNYRRAVCMIENRAAACKAEKQRLDVLQKTRERAAKRLKDSMLEALLLYGETGKSGNKIIELDDCRLSTRDSTECIVETNLILKLLDACLERFRELWNVDMLDQNKDDVDNLDEDSFIQTVNQNFAAENEDIAEHIQEKLGTLFTRDDLESTKIKIEINIPLIELCKKINYDIVNTYFNHEHQANISIDSSKSDYKSYIQNRDAQLLVAYLCKNQSLQIK